MTAPLPPFPSSLPVVGITCCRKVRESWPVHSVGEKYVTAVSDAAGALPLLVPALATRLDVDMVLARLDGLLLTGSPSNIEPHHYLGDPSEPGTWHDPERDLASLALIPAAIRVGMPLFAICRGCQELNVVLGGTLHQKLADVPGLVNHKEDPSDPLEIQYGPAHRVDLVDGGLLRQLAGTPSVTVNSLHGQGIRRLAPGVTVEAVAEDGLVEAFSVDDVDGFALAVQWHPEWHAADNAFSLAMFREFGRACTGRARQRQGAG